LKIFVINLQKSETRRQFMKKQLDRLGLDHEFSNAVDGRLLTPEELEVMCDMKKAREWANLFTPGMIGCSLSHYAIYQQIVKRAIPYALILEDDTRLAPDIGSVLINIEQLLISESLSKDEPVLLYYQSIKPVRFSSLSQVLINNNHTINYPVNIWEPITTAAYVISYQCAKRLTELVYPVRYSADSWGVFYREGAILGLRCVLPLPVESGYFKSDIGYELDKPLNRAVKKVESYNIFPVAQLLKLRRQLRARRLNRYTIIDVPLEWERKQNC
jgi:glycosyl transferase, family 25